MLEPNTISSNGHSAPAGTCGSQCVETVWCRTGLLVAIWCLAVAACCAASPDEAGSVVVIFNAHSKDSQTVAEHYAERRHVPADQILGLKLPMTDEMSRVEYRKLLQEPLLAWLMSKKHWTYGAEPKSSETNAVQIPIRADIRYAVLCYDVPLKITGDNSIAEPGLDKAPLELRHNEAAVDSELALLPQVGPGVRLTGPAINRTFATTNRFAIHPTNGVMAVARLDGPSPEIANALVDKAMEAETNGLWGRAYFDLRGLKDGPYKLGDDFLRAAASVAHRQGFETVVDEAEATLPPAFPLSHVGIYCGWYAGDACGPFLKPKVEFMAGAFAYHLHSFSAHTLHSTTRNWCGPLLARGATATMGCVYEPYLAGTPDMGVFLSRWIDLGFSFGEASIAGQQVLSWQTTVVGDPLYRPFGRSAKELHEDLLRRNSPLIEWSHLRVVNLNLASGLREPQLVSYLEEIPVTKMSAVLLEKLGDLYSASGKPSSAVRAYEAALKLNPSPQQRVRLTLQLAEKLAAGSQFDQAISMLEEFMKQHPDFEDAASLYRKLAAWAKSIGKADDAARYEKAADRLAR